MLIIIGVIRISRWSIRLNSIPKVYPRHGTLSRIKECYESCLNIRNPAHHFFSFEISFPEPPRRSKPISPTRNGVNVYDFILGDRVVFCSSNHRSYWSDSPSTNKTNSAHWENSPHIISRRFWRCVDGFWRYTDASFVFVDGCPKVSVFYVARPVNSLLTIPIVADLIGGVASRRSLLLQSS